MTQPAAQTASATGHVAVTGTESGALSAATLTSGAAVGASASQTVSVPPAQLHRQACYFHNHTCKYVPIPLPTASPPMPLLHQPSSSLALHLLLLPPRTLAPTGL